MPPTSAPWLALLRVLLARTLPQLRVFALFSTGLVVLFTTLDRGGVNELLQYAAVCAMAFIGHPPGCAIRFRQDGSLRYLGTLPVSPDQHAACWIALCALHALPSALLLPALMARPPVNLPLAHLPGTALGVLLFATAAAAGLLALQLRGKAGSGPTVMIIFIGVMLAASSGFSWLAKHAPPLADLPVSLPVLLAGVGVASILAALAMLRVAWAVIGRAVTFAWADAPAR